MTADAKHLLKEFGALPDTSKREVLAELLRVSRHLDYPEMSDEELTSAANDVFLAYDERETGE
ncbi:MAG TPA: hypothetical protein VF701_22615 [Thermoanaerobaculia bacterium]